MILLLICANTSSVSAQLKTLAPLCERLDQGVKDYYRNQKRNRDAQIRDARQYLVQSDHFIANAKKAIDHLAPQVKSAMHERDSFNKQLADLRIKIKGERRKRSEREQQIINSQETSSSYSHVLRDAESQRTSIQNRVEFLLGKRVTATRQLQLRSVLTNSEYQIVDNDREMQALWVQLDRRENQLDRISKSLFETDRHWNAANSEIKRLNDSLQKLEKEAQLSKGNYVLRSRAVASIQKDIARAEQGKRAARLALTSLGAR